VAAERVVLTGASGFVGRAAARRLAAEGVPLTLLARPDSALPEPGGDVRVVRAADIADRGALREAMRDAAAAVHLAGRAHRPGETGPDRLAAYLDDNLRPSVAIAAEAATAGLRGVLFMSTVSVHGNGAPGAPALTAESRLRPESAYAASKAAAEAALRTLLEGGPTDLVVLRPTLVCGVGAVGNLERLVRLVARGVPLPFGAVRNRRTLTGVDGLADAVAAVLRRWREGRASGTWTVGDAAPVSLAEMVEALRRGLGRGGPSIPVPAPLLSAALGAASRGARDRLLGDLEVDPQPFARAFGWTPPSDTLAVLEAMARARRPAG